MRRSSVRPSHLALVLTLAAACTTYDPLYCDENHECTDPDRPFCDLTGQYPASDGVARTCIADPDPMIPLDGGNPDATPDGGFGGSDARVFSYPQPEAYWAFDEQDLTGGTLVPREGALSGTVVGTTVEPSTVVGEALVLDGGEDRVDFGDALDDVIAGPDRKFSISVWVKPRSVTGTQMLLVKAGADSCKPPEDTRQFAFALTAGVPNVRFWTPANANARYVGTTTPLVLDVWQHVLATYDGGIDLGPVDRVRIYVDGVPQPLEILDTLGGFPYDIQPTEAHLAIGKIVGSSGGPCGAEQLNAALDELAVWSSVLTPQNAADIYARGGLAQPLWPL